MPDYLAPDEGEIQENQQITPSALAILNQSEHAAMVATANVQANRRKLADFESKLMAYANHSQPVALLMFYSLPRANKQIIGPSVRFSEIVAPCWRNCAVAGRVVGDAQSTVTAQGVFLDYEYNMRNSVEVPRRITDKDGRRYSDDMVITTSNAAMSVARRNAVLKGGVPQALWTPSYEAAQLTAVGKNETHAQRVDSAMDYLSKKGLTEWQVLNAVGVAGIKELEMEHLLTLRVLCEEIKRGDKTIDQVFGSPYDKEIDALFVQLKVNVASQTMLRKSYLGRAAELVTHLRERLGPASAMSGEPVNKEPFRPQVHVSDVASYPSGQTGSAAYSDKMNPEEVAAHLETQQTVPPLGTVKDGKTITGPEGNLVQQWDPKEHAAAYAAAYGPETTSGGVTTVSGGAGETPAPPQAKRRGRPTLEDVARRRAQEQGTLPGTQEPEPTEQQARQEVEDMAGKMDQFAF
jgi:hypothetical protein